MAENVPPGLRTIVTIRMWLSPMEKREPKGVVPGIGVAIRMSHSPYGNVRLEQRNRMPVSTIRTREFFL